MKILILVMTLLLNINLFADEAWSNVVRPNLEVKMGELTGAGSRYSIKNLAGFVHPNGYILKEECANIVLKQTNDPKISDIVKIQVGEQEILASELTGFIIQSKK